MATPVDTTRDARNSELSASGAAGLAVSGALAKVGRYRWTICALLFFATTINYIDRQVLGILGPTLQRDLGWNEQQFGDVVSWFTIAYAIGFLFAGRIMDRFGTRRGFAGCDHRSGASSAMAHALARTAAGFSIGALRARPRRVGKFSGVDQDGRRVVPVARARVGDRHLQRRVERRRDHHADPRAVDRAATGDGDAAFIATGALGFIWLVPWLLIYRPPREHPKCGPAELAHIRSEPVEPARRVGWMQLLRHRQTWAFAIGKLMTDPIWWFYLYWLPKFLDSRYGIKLAQLAAPLIVIYLLADVGSVFGGWLSGAFIKRGWSVNAGRKTTMLIAALVIVPTMFAPDGDQHVGRGGDRRCRRGGAPMVVGEHLHAHERHVPAVRRRLGGGNRRILRRGRRRVVPARHGLGAAAQRKQLHADLPRLRHSRTSPR